MLFGLANLSYASLTVRGTDSLGNQLIYDSDLNLTWYDYTHRGPFGYGDNWQNQMNWANNLTVNFNGNSITGWNLPTTVDGLSWGYDGTTSNGYNITSSPLGYLYYNELGNKGLYSTYGSQQFDHGYLLSNTGPFKNLISDWYWSSTKYSIDNDYSWYFSFSTGEQSTGSGGGMYGLAVLPGDVTPTPIPPSCLLMGTGLIGIFGFRKSLCCYK